MHFTVGAAEFREALSVVARALSVRPALPVLEGVLMEAKGGALKLTASDGTLTIHASVSVSVEEEGTALAPGRFLLDAARKLPDGSVSIKESRPGTLVASCQSARISIACQYSGEYPSLPEVDGAAEFTVMGKALRSMVAETSFCVADEDPRVVLTGALLRAEEGAISIVALDGFRLAMRTLAGTISKEVKASAIVPKKSLVEAARLLPDGGDGPEVTVRVNRYFVSFDLGGVTIYSRLIDGEYINYQRIIPQGWKTRVTVDSRVLSESMERASLVAREGKNNLIRVDVEPLNERIVVTSNSEIGASYEEIEAGIQGGEMSIAFNVRFLTEAFRAMPEANVRLTMSSPLSPMVVTPADEGQEGAFLYLILPVRAAA